MLKKINYIFIFRLLLIIVTLFSLFFLLKNIYNNTQQLINSWQFPMLLAILIEEINII
jgi:hypothetical protein